MWPQGPPSFNDLAGGAIPLLPTQHPGILGHGLGLVSTNETTGIWQAQARGINREAQAATSTAHSTRHQQQHGASVSAPQHGDPQLSTQVGSNAQGQALLRLIQAKKKLDNRCINEITNSVPTSAYSLPADSKPCKPTWTAFAALEDQARHLDRGRAVSEGVLSLPQDPWGEQPTTAQHGQHQTSHHDIPEGSKETAAAVFSSFFQTRGAQGNGNAPTWGGWGGIWGPSKGDSPAHMRHENDASNHYKDTPVHAPSIPSSNAATWPQQLHGALLDTHSGSKGVNSHYDAPPTAPAVRPNMHASGLPPGFIPQGSPAAAAFPEHGQPPQSMQPMAAANANMNELQDLSLRIRSLELRASESAPGPRLPASATGPHLLRPGTNAMPTHNAAELAAYGMLNPAHIHQPMGTLPLQVQQHLHHSPAHNPALNPTRAEWDQLQLTLQLSQQQPHPPPPPSAAAAAPIGLSEDDLLLQFQRQQLLQQQALLLQRQQQQQPLHHELKLQHKGRHQQQPLELLPPGMAAQNLMEQQLLHASMAPSLSNLRQVWQENRKAAGKAFPPPPPTLPKELQRPVHSARPELGKPSLQGPQCRADPALLSARLSELAQSLAPSEEERQAHASAFQGLKKLLLQRWPEAEVCLFGSAANELCITNSNDIDVTLVLPSVPDTQAAKSEIVDQMGLLLAEAGMLDIQVLRHARVPVCKCRDPQTGTHMDVTVNNLLALVNTKLLRDYTAIDPRLRQMVFLVKHWAKRRGINDSYRGTLSSYAYVLLCISLLQQRSPPILPALQATLPLTFTRHVGAWTCAFNDDLEALRGFGAANSEGLAELLSSFFDYWAWRHDYNGMVVSIRTGGLLSKAEKNWTTRVGTERHLVCIEDPFELTHDLGRTIDRNSVVLLRREFERAAKVMANEDDPLPLLYEQRLR